MKKYTLLFLFLSVIFCKEKTTEQDRSGNEKETKVTINGSAEMEKKKVSRFIPPSGVYSMVDTVTMSSFLSADIIDAKEYCLEINLENNVAIAKFRKNSNKYKLEIENADGNKFSLFYRGKKRVFEYKHFIFHGNSGYNLYCEDYSKRNNKGEWNGGTECGGLEDFQSIEECEAHFEKYIKDFGDVKSEETM